VVGINGTIMYSGIRSVLFDHPSQTGVSIYPNPVSDVLFLASTTINGKVDLEITNTAGQVLRTYHLSMDYGVAIPVSYLPKGIYFVKLSKQSVCVVQKIIKE